MPPAKPYHHGNLRAALLDAALELLVSTEPRHLTLREVARRAGVSHAAPYRHFAEKDDLLAALAEDGFHRLAAAVTAAPDLPAAGRAYLAFALAHPQHFRLLFSTPLDPQRHPSALEAAQQAFNALLTHTIHLPGRVPPPLTAAKTAWAHVHGLAELALAGRLRLPPDPFIDHSLAILIAGLRAPAA